MTGPDRRSPGGGTPKPPSDRRDDSTFGPTERAGGAAFETSDLYRLLVESVQDYAIFALDSAGYILSWNPGAKRFKGYEAEEIIGRHFSVFYEPDEIAQDIPGEELRVAAAVGRVEAEGWRLRKDGTRFWANVTISALRSETGDLVGFAKVTRDLTERRRAEEILRQSEERFRLLLESVRDYGIFMLDPDGRVASWNVGAERINGYSADQIIGRHLSVFYPPEDVVAGKPARELRDAAELGRFEEEGWRVRRDGSRYWANAVVTPLRNAAGDLLGFAKVTRDMTLQVAARQRALADARRLAAQEAARTSAEERAKELSELLTQLRDQALELRAQREVADGANRAKSQFLATMSHELRTPLNAIGGYVQLLAMGLRGPVTEDQRLDLERIRRSQQHLLGIINDILNFSRLEAGQVAYEIAPVAVQDLLDAVHPMIAPQADAKGVIYEQVPCEPELRVLGDQAKIEQILLNLLSNAVKFTPEGGHISLMCMRQGDRTQLQVRDTGRGIPQGKLESIFEPFVQVERSLTRPVEGMGLGLAISRDLARGMGGDIAVESEIGEGSVFTLTLPSDG
jgi:PAS domain S-box-containing protein